MKNAIIELDKLETKKSEAIVCDGTEYVIALISIKNIEKTQEDPKKFVSPYIKAKEENERYQEKKNQKEVIESLYGAWPINETSDELISRIKSSRKSTNILQMEEE